jgi:hypothetical protein
LILKLTDAASLQKISIEINSSFYSFTTGLIQRNWLLSQEKTPLGHSKQA